MVPGQSSGYGDSRLTLGDDGILRQRFSPGTVVTGRDAYDCLDAKRRLAGDGPCPLLLDLRQVLTVERDARLCYTGPEFSGHACAVALLADSPLTRMIATFLLTLYRPAYPVRLFDNEADALGWLEVSRA